MPFTGYNLELMLKVCQNRCQIILDQIRQAKNTVQQPSDRTLTEKILELWEGSELNRIAGEFHDVDLCVKKLVCHQVDENEFLSEILIIRTYLPPIGHLAETICQEVEGICDRGAYKIAFIAKRLLQRNISKK